MSNPPQVALQIGHISARVSEPQPHPTIGQQFDIDPLTNFYAEMIKRCLRQRHLSFSGYGQRDFHSVLFGKR